MKEVYVVNCCRTAVGSFGGSLKDTPATELGAVVVKEALNRAGVKPEQVDELMFGCILTAAQGQNPARQVGVKAGLPYSVPAYTVGMVCGAGMKTQRTSSRGSPSASNTRPWRSFQGTNSSILPEAGRNILRTISREAGPERRTIAMAPLPWAVAWAAMVVSPEDCFVIPPYSGFLRIMTTRFLAPSP